MDTQQSAALASSNSSRREVSSADLMHCTDMKAAQQRAHCAMGLRPGVQPFRGQSPFRPTTKVKTRQPCTDLILPAAQVYKVFAQLSPAMGVRLGLASGKLPLAVEADALSARGQEAPCSAVDVLVATPGRLMSHVQGTPGISLDALKMLVGPPALCMVE